MRNKMTNIENIIARRNEIVTCETCERTGSRYSQNVQMFYSDGERYYGSPLKQGSIIVEGMSCGNCVRTQANSRQALLYVSSSPIAPRELRVNEMP
jgi:hypothetical protein